MAKSDSQGKAFDPEEWIRYAERDLRMARLAYDTHEDDLANHIGFHAQQCVEKSIKAVLVHRGIRFPKVHDIGALLDLMIDCGAAYPDWMNVLDDITFYAVEVRYPGRYEPPEMVDCGTALNWAKDQIQGG